MNPLAALKETREDIGPIQAQPGLGNAASPKNILVLQLARLGDLVQTWPLLSRLRRAYPGARLSLLTDRRLLPLQAAGPEVDEVIGFDFLQLGSLATANWPGAYQLLADFHQDLQTRRFDLVFNLNFSRLSLLLTHLLGARAKGYLSALGGREFSREPWLAWIYSLVHARRFNRFHLTDVFRHLAPESGTAPAMGRAGAGLKEEPVIALQLATRHVRRTWPLEHFTRLAEYLVRHLSARVLLVGTKAERSLGERLRAALPDVLRERVVNLQGRTGLEELAARLEQTHLLISGDTGTLHLAAALGVPTVALFLGPALCFETGPYGSGHYVLQAEPPCHPCTEAASPCPQEGPICLEMLPPELVGRLVSGLLETGKAAADLSLPAGSRLYGSEMDAFGVFYRCLGNEPLRFLDLVGDAYRRAGVWLAGEEKGAGAGGQGPGAQAPVAQASRLYTLDPPPTPYREREKLSSMDLHALEELRTFLHQGLPVPPELPEAAAALRPLLAFQAEMQRQGREELFAGVKAVFAAHL
ncbi:MAG: glycosyltransferase family 9 protein [Deltaproteobacteria bacterium]|nr:MAG: glycosyltransferase family 9 protein [Deltaproteobacteria bacterium]